MAKFFNLTSLLFLLVSTSVASAAVAASEAQAGDLAFGCT